jgi:hypothetical protein
MRQDFLQEIIKKYGFVTCTCGAKFKTEKEFIKHIYEVHD